VSLGVRDSRSEVLGPDFGSGGSPIGVFLVVFGPFFDHFLASFGAETETETVSRDAI
jgi:hypothetical protein